VSFFDAIEPAPPPPRAPEYRNPPWSGPPDNVVAATVALDVVLARTGDIAAWIGAAAVYPAGVELALAVSRAHARPEWDHHPPFLGEHVPGGPRFGVGFADGRRAVAGHGAHLASPTGDAATEIALWPRGSSGSNRGWRGDHWLWPLPPEGPLTFAFAWPAEGVAEVTVQVDSAPLREAAARAAELWPDDRPEPPRGGSGWASYAPGP
jgi:hypothetical protein